MDNGHDTAIEAVLEQLIEQGPEGIATVFARTFEIAMRIERERFLGAQRYERTPERRGYANGYKSNGSIHQPAQSTWPFPRPLAMTTSLSSPGRSSADAARCARSCWRSPKCT